MVAFDLTQLLGIYFFVVGIIVIVRRSAFMPAMRQLLANRSMLYLIALAELLAGIAIVLAYTEVTLSKDGLISLIGWVLVVESVFYMLAPMRDMQRLMKRFSTPTWYLAQGLAMLLVGAYLTGVGFGWLH